MVVGDLREEGKVEKIGNKETFHKNELKGEN